MPNSFWVIPLIYKFYIYKVYLPGVGGGGGTLLQEVIGDLPLDGVAISRLEWL